MPETLGLYFRGGQGHIVRFTLPDGEDVGDFWERYTAAGVDVFPMPLAALKQDPWSGGVYLDPEHPAVQTAYACSVMR